MGIWIRSQDKEVLTECVSFWYDDNLPFHEGYIIRSDDFCLGEYSTKDNVLKVLDMIQEHIDDIIGECEVFEMPQDDDV